MAESEKVIVFGVHQVIPYVLATGLPYQPFEVLGAASLNSTLENVELFGGSNKTAYAVENTVFNHEFTFGLKEFPPSLYELFLGKAPTEVAASATGSAQNLANVSGVSTFDATTGVATVTVESGEEANVKTAYYVIKAVTTSTFDVYILSDLDKNVGTALTIQDDAQKITAAPLTLVTGAAVTIPNTGLELTGGSGTIALVAGETASFDSSGIHSGTTNVVIGSSSQIFPEFGCVVVGEKRATKEIFTINLFKVVATSGATLPFGEKEFGETDLVLKCIYDATKDGTYKVTHTKNVA